MEDDDFFGEDTGIDHERNMADREWRQLKDQFENTGYLEGIEAAKEDTIQQGFNEGYKESTAIGHEVGELRGILSVLLQVVTKESNPELNTRISALLEELSQVKHHTFFTPSALKALAKEISATEGCCGGSKGKKQGQCCKDPAGSQEAIANQEQLKGWREQTHQLAELAGLKLVPK